MTSHDSDSADLRDGLRRDLGEGLGEEFVQVLTEMLGDDLLADDPLADDPLADDPLADDPLADGLLADGLLAEGLRNTCAEGSSDGGALEDALVQNLLGNPALRGLLGDVVLAEALAEKALAEGDAACNLSAHVRAAALAAFEAGEGGLSEEDLSEEDLGEERMGEGEVSDGLERELLLDVFAASEAAAAESLSPTVRSMALAAFARESLAREPLRARSMRPLLTPRSWAAAAAMLVVFLGAAMFLTGRGQEAEAGLQFSSLARVDRAGAMRMSQVQPRYFAEMGSRFAPAEDELLAFGFGPGSRLIVGSGDAVRVTDADDVRATVGADVLRDGVALQGVDLQGRACMRLDSGEVLLVTRSRPVPLLVAGAGLFVLLDGAAHVAVTRPHGIAGGEVAVALPRASRARFYAHDGSQVELTGPATGLLTAAGAGNFGEEARSLFEELKFFGGPLPRVVREAPISARSCSVRSGEVRRGRQDLQILRPEPSSAGPEPRTPAMNSVGTIDATLSWRPRPWQAEAHLLRVHLRAPAGTHVSIPSVAAAGTASTAEVAGRGNNAGTLASEPGLAVLDLPLAPGWYERLNGGPLLLEVRVSAVPNDETRAHASEARASETRASEAVTRRGVVAWFDGLTVVLASPQPDENAPAARLRGRWGAHDD